MNNYSIETNRTTSPQAAGKAAQSTQASQAAQAFSDFLSGTKTTAKTPVASPVLKHDTAALNQLFNKPTWHLEQDASSNRDDRRLRESSETHRGRKNVTHDEEDKSASLNEKTEIAPEEQTEKSVESQAEERPREERSARQNESETKTPDVVAVETAKAQVSDPAVGQGRISAVQTAAVPGGPTQQTAQAPQQLPSGTAVTQGDTTAAGKAATPSVQVTQAAVTSQPTSNLTAAASVSAINTSETTTAATAGAAAQSNNGKSTSALAGPETGAAKTASQGPNPQAVMANTSGQGTNNNAQSQNGNNLARTEIGAAAGAKPASTTTAVNGFTETLHNATRTAGASGLTTELKPQKTLNVTASDQLSISIKKAVGENKDSISIKLHPSELGRVDVKLEIAENGVMKAMISAERPDTLDLLQRDSRLLEKALQDAGLKTDGQSLSFNLKQNGDQNGASGDRSAFAASQDDSQSSDTDMAENDLPQQNPIVSRHDGDLDISI
ncbi:flagellar hook-length control protein FliK [Kiloniella laminariae]|uniref:Flagellar hook-length control protein FliK n=1 Tax=Kiloniella laminariae TaxID=454162 RepID=A0ABT4LHE8_9PROT|nr:flagellar hook-length control protein FliK [Kiloniella laminariae]MCZ4280519.1 flagellar hook-length control protein FliK [Kiloniella laminariae]